MGVTRILDLIVVILLATILLMPRPDASVKPALTVDAERSERVAELQSVLIGRPDDVDASVELGNIFLDGHRPDWTLATIGAALPYHGNDYRLYNMKAIAYADRFEGAPALEAGARALELCEHAPSPGAAPTCDDAAHSRLSLLVSTLRAIARVDMKGQPYLAKELIMRQLHPAYIPRPKPKRKPAPPAAP